MAHCPGWVCKEDQNPSKPCQSRCGERSINTFTSAPAGEKGSADERGWKTTPHPAKSYKSRDCNRGVDWNRPAINNHSVIFIISCSETNQFNVSQFSEAETIPLEVMVPWLIVSMSTSQRWLPSSWRVQGNSHCSNSLEFPGLQIRWLWLCCWVKYNT